MRADDALRAGGGPLVCDLCSDEHPTHVMAERAEVPPGGDALCAVCVERLEGGDWQAALSWIALRHDVPIDSRDAELLGAAARPRWEELRALLLSGARPRPI